MKLINTKVIPFNSSDLCLSYVVLPCLSCSIVDDCLHESFEKTFCQFSRACSQADKCKELLLWQQNDKVENREIAELGQLPAGTP